MLLFLILASLILILTLWYILSFLGIFHKINIRVEKPNFLQERVYIAYKCFTGSYTEAYRSFNYINSICPLESNRVLSIYYDDPQKTEKGKQRFLIGIILNDSLSVDKSTLETCLVQKNGFSCVCLGAIRQAVLTEYPIRTKLSIWIACWRVYPMLTDFIKTNKLEAYPFVEYYDNKKIRFYVPLCENKESYLVEEYFERKEKKN